MRSRFIVIGAVVVMVVSLAFIAIRKGEVNRRYAEASVQESLESSFQRLQTSIREKKNGSDLITPEDVKGAVLGDSRRKLRGFSKVDIDEFFLPVEQKRLGSTNLICIVRFGNGISCSMDGKGTVMPFRVVGTNIPGFESIHL